MARGEMLMVMILALSVSWSQAQDQNSWAKTVNAGNQSVTTLQFYYHDTLTGSNPTSMRVVQASGSSPSAGIPFSSLMMADNPLTIGPDPNSKQVGRARGLYGSAGKDEISLITAMDYGFTDGNVAGSSFSLLSLNPAVHPVREMSIIGGTGVFRMARGYAIAQTYFFDPSTGDAIFGYNVTIASNI